MRDGFIIMDIGCTAQVAVIMYDVIWGSAQFKQYS